MKRNSKINEINKRSTVTFCSSKLPNFKPYIQQEEEQFKGRTKTNKYPSLVRFKKLQICSQQSQSGQQTNSKPIIQQNDTFSQRKSLLQCRTSKKAFTEYRTQRQSIYSRTSQKKKTMIPIKVRQSKRHQNENSFFTRRITKSCSKVDDKNSVQNMSLKSIHSKYTKLKRQASSLWSIPTNKLINPTTNKSPTKILQKQQKSLFFLQKQFRMNLRIFQQEQQKRILLTELLFLIQKQIQFNENGNGNELEMSKKNYFEAKCPALLTQIPLNASNGMSTFAKTQIWKSQSIANTNQDNLQNKISSLHKIINKMSKQQNLAKSKIQKMKEQVLCVRKQRVMYSSLFKKIQKEIKDQQKQFICILIENRNKLGLTIDIQIGSNFQKVKALVLKQYYQNNNIAIDCQTNTATMINATQNLPYPSSGLYNIKKQQSGVEDTINLMKNYNSFSFPNFSFYQSEQQKLKVFKDNKNKVLIKPRKQMSSNHSQKLSQFDIQTQEMQRISMIQQFIQKLGLKMDIQRPRRIIRSNSNENKTKLMSSSNYFSSMKHKNTSQFQHSMDLAQCFQFRQSQKQLYPKVLDDAFKTSTVKTQNIISITNQIVRKNDTLSHINKQYLKKIEEINLQIGKYQSLIYKEKQLNKVRIISTQYQIEKKKQQMLKQDEIIQNKKNLQLFTGIINVFCQSELKLNVATMWNKKGQSTRVDGTSFLHIMNILSQDKQDCYLNMQNTHKYDDKIYNFVSKLEEYHQASKLHAVEKNCINKNTSNQNQNLESKRQSLMQNCYNDLSRDSDDGRQFIQKQNFNNKQQKKELFQTFSQQSDRIESLQSCAGQQLCSGPNKRSENQSFNQYKDIKSIQSTSDKVGIQSQQRPSKGVSTLIANMSIFQSYEKALSRQDFEQQYRKQMLYGRKKKKTLLKRMPACVSIK